MLPLMLAECDSCNTSSVADETCCALDSQHMCPFSVQHSEAHNINACAAECLIHWPKQSSMLRPLWSLCTGPTAYVHVQCTALSPPHSIRLYTEAPKDLCPRVGYMNMYYHEYQVKHNNVQKDPQTQSSHSPPKCHHPSLEYCIPTTFHQTLHRSSKGSLFQSGIHAHVLPWISSKTQRCSERSTDSVLPQSSEMSPSFVGVAHFVCVHRHIKKSKRSERQASACLHFKFRGGGSFCSLIFSHNATSCSHHTSHINSF